MTTEYQESAEFIKLFLRGGEIDIEVGTPLTESPWEVVAHGGRTIRVETCAEIIAKKMHHRAAFLQRLEERHDLAKDEFDKIERIAYQRSFDDCMSLAQEILAVT